MKKNVKKNFYFKNYNEIYIWDTWGTGDESLYPRDILWIGVYGTGVEINVFRNLFQIRIICYTRTIKENIKEKIDKLKKKYI